MKLFNPVNKKGYLTDADLVQAAKGVHTALKSQLPPMVYEAVGAILHKEMESMKEELAKSYETRLSDLRKSYERRLSDVQQINDKNIEGLTDLVKAVSVPGVSEDVGMEIVLRASKLLEDKVEKRLAQIKDELEGQLKTITESVMDDMDAMTKAFDDKQELLINFVKNFTVQNSFVVPENGIKTSVEVKQLPSQVNFEVPKESFKLEAKTILQPSKAPVVNLSIPEKAIQVEHKTILEEADKESVKDIDYSETTGRPTRIKERITRIKK